MLSHRCVSATLVAFGLLIIGDTLQAQTVDTQRLSISPTGGQLDRDFISVALSGDAHFAAFDGNLVGANDTRWFLRDVVAQQTGVQVVPNQSSSVTIAQNFISDDARIVAFQINNVSYPETRVFDRTSAVVVKDLGDALVALSRNGRWLLTNPYGRPDLVINDLVNDVTSTLHYERTGTDTNGSWTEVYAFGVAAISDDGLWIAYALSGPSPTSNVHTHDSGLYLYDVTNHSALRIATDNGDFLSEPEPGKELSITPDGRYLAYCSIGEGVTTVRVFDRVAGYSHRVSNAGGVVPNGHSHLPSISSDGRYVAFSSVATNIVPGDTNGDEDVFRFDRQAQKVMRVSLSSAGVQGDGISRRPSITADGMGIAFLSSATNLVTGDTNGFGDAFLAKVSADAVSVPSTPPTPTPPTGGGGQPATSTPSTPGTPAGSTSTSNSGNGNRCGFGAGAVGLALMLGGVRRRRIRTDVKLDQAHSKLP